MTFSLLEIFFFDSHWWISVGFFEFRDDQFAFLHIERDFGVWKFDFLWLYAFFRRLKDELG